MPATSGMVSTLHWSDLLLRLAVAIIAGAVLGANRVERGKPAGLRTTVLVCLAAATAMLLANLLLGTRGKHPDSFAQFDVMRLPLGILTGMGFIGGGAILRRRDLVIGVTTAATLWLATVIGLCIGAGEIRLGVLVTALGFAVLVVLAAVERRMPQERLARLAVAFDRDAQLQDALLVELQGAGFAVTDVALSFMDRSCEARFDLRWRTRPADTGPPNLLAELARRPDIRAVRWDLTPH